jgi:hypothetical protein
METLLLGCLVGVAILALDILLGFLAKHPASIFARGHHAIEYPDAAAFEPAPGSRFCQRER